MNDIAKIAKQSLSKAGVHTIKIKDSEYTIELLPATSAFAVATQILKIALPALGAYVDGSKKEDFILPEDNDMFAGIGILLVSQLDKVSVTDLISVLTQNIKKDGIVIVIDDEFKGNLGGLIALLEFVLKENCGSFFMDYLQVKGISLPSLKNAMETSEETLSS